MHILAHGDNTHSVRPQTQFSTAEFLEYQTNMGKMNRGLFFGVGYFMTKIIQLATN